MLISFSIKNFRSYRDEKTISLVASKTARHADSLITVPALGEQKLSRCAAVYGANASGKSNLIAGMNCLAALLQDPLTVSHSAANFQSPFFLDATSFIKPTQFTVQFISNDIVYEYVLGVDKDGTVAEESLTAFPSERGQLWFKRKFQDIDFNKNFLKGPKRSLSEVTPVNRPYLSVASAFSHPMLSPIAQWITANLCRRLDFWEDHMSPASQEELVAMRMHKDPDFTRWANSFLTSSGLGIEGVDAVPVAQFAQRPASSAEEAIASKDQKEVVQPFFRHKFEDGYFSFPIYMESAGTRRIFSMLVPLHDVLTNGRVAVIDEFSAALHPSMVREMIKLFQDPARNSKNAQLIFATHDVALLGGHLLRRDQVWFTEKSPTGVTDLYSLHDIKGVREEDPFDKNYLQGRYGAIPFFGKFDFPGVDDAEE